MIDGGALSGGMGVVYRATDLAANQKVAVKVPHYRGPVDLERFSREVSTLARLRDPRIVRYVAHGATLSGVLFLVTEWLEGETLAVRLRRGALEITSVLCIARDVARAMAYAHASSVVHRDLKPSNILLVGSSLDDARVIDFGIARTIGAEHLTAAGAVVGTPHYMSPEQARAERDVGAASDVYSLGCVLYRCLTGLAPHERATGSAALWRIAFDSAPPLRDALPNAPTSVCELIDDMLAQQAGDRPRDGRAVLDRLESILASRPIADVHQSACAPSRITRTEVRLASLVAIRSECVGGKIAQDVSAAASTHLDERHTRIDALADGDIVVRVAAGPDARLAVERAGAFVVALRSEVPAAHLVLVSGRSGQADDTRALATRASALLDATPTGDLRVDANTAAMLRLRYRFEPLGGGTFRLPPSPALTLRPSRSPPSASRCIGRNKDIALLIGICEESFGESVARAALVTGPPGIGKSRLREEVVRRTLAAWPAATLIGASADPVGTRSPFALWTRALRESVAAAARRGDCSLDTFLRDLTGPSFPPHLTELALEALVQRPTDSVTSAHLSRRGATQLQGALEGVMEAWTRRGPTLVVLDDMQWSDAPSIRAVGELLRRLSDRPLLVLGFARPEIRDQFPRLWDSADTQELRLMPLTPSASFTLASDTLSGQTAARVKRVCALASGNPFVIEELARLGPAGDLDNVPESVLALVDRRIMRLAPEARRTLRAASIFGETFPVAGLHRLLAVTHDGATRLVLDCLVRAEFITEEPSLEPGNDAAYRIRHSLIREAAYAAIPLSDRAASHRIVLDWLLDHGERDEWLLAAHDEKAAVSDVERAAASDRWCGIARTSPCHVEALEALDHARRLLDAMRTPDCDRIDELDRSWIFHLAGGPDRAAVTASLREILAEARSARKHTRLVSALSALVCTLAGLGAIEEARALELEANALARDPRDRLTVAKARSLRALFARDLDEMVLLTEEIVLLASTLGRDDDTAAYLHNLGELHLRGGRLVEGRNALERSSTLAANHAAQWGLRELNLTLLAYVDAIETGGGGALAPLLNAIERLHIGGLAFEEITGRLFLGHAFARRGEPSLAIVQFALAMACAKSVGYASYVEEARAAMVAMEAGTVPLLGAG